MNTGQYISGVAHIGLIGWALIGGAFKPAPEPFEVTEVAMISSEEFEAMIAPTEAPSLETDMSALIPPDSETAEPEPPQAEIRDSAPVIAEPDEAAPPPEPEEAPDVAALLPPDPPAEVEDAAPVLVPPVEAPVTAAPDISDRPQTRPTTRVAPEPVAPPEPDVKIDDIAQEDAVDDGAADIQREQQEQTAEEEAATEIVTEAEASSSAPSTSVRPRTRPTRVARPEPEPETDTGTKDAVADALAQALAGDTAETTTPARPSGPPLTSGEKDALRVAVQKCWNTGALSTEALRTTVVVTVQMNQDGTPETGTIRMVDSRGGSSGSANQAFQAARRAIIRCGARGFDLPADKYEQWREIEMTFNPEKMRIK
ncbi:energy transducer TonB [Thalassovita aquimarina]|uniref:Energy transducer TonB n=1 Tax=Thalassovita aquimarina TaxID=2785917 RepID=A0ABS5HVQ7_9RHOB|nr:energy transducer TonB [Thalassovita aquimarina]MBR9652653.1 energy transducer TonB [Thalassovita aquimarina]